jgi:hypothetical protein
MKTFKIVLLIVLTYMLAFLAYGQESPVVLQRTPEQEAIKQTEKLQQELNLSREQAKLIYEINLRYARERQISNKRSEALERMKNKNSEIQQVLTTEQSNRLQNKRYERTNIDAVPVNRTQSVNASGFRAMPQNRANSVTDINQRVNNRPVNPNYRTQSQQEQTNRRSTTTFRSTQIQNNPSLNRPTTENSPNVPRRSENTAPAVNSSRTSPQTPQSTSPRSPDRTTTPVTTPNRR